MIHKKRKFLSLVFMSILFCSCGTDLSSLNDEGGDDINLEEEGALLCSVGGNISGLEGTLTLANGDLEVLEIDQNGSFAFETPMEDGQTYLVTISQQPAFQTCSVSNGAGDIESEDIANIEVVCSTDTYSVGGTLSGLVGSVTLQNNNADDLLLSSDGAFTFASEVADGSGYEVIVTTQPDTQTCTVSSGSGTLNGANVDDVSVVCSTNTYTVGGSISGLSGTVTLQNNDGDDLDISENGSFTFSTEVADGSDYAVTVLTQPDGQTCSISGGSGTIDGSAIENVSVTCENNPDLRIFITVTDHESGNFGGPSGADGDCMADDNYPGSGTFKALLVDGSTRRACSTANCSGGASENIDWVLAPNTQYVRLDGSTVIGKTNASGIFDFTSGNLTNPFLDSGDPLQAYLWTGLKSDWTLHPDNCDGWTSNLGHLNGQSGLSFATSSNSIAYTDAGWCDSFGQPARLICVEQ